MAERKKSKGKGNEGEEGTDGSKQKGGAEGKDHQEKRSRLSGAAHFVHKRVTGQPKSTPKKKQVNNKQEEEGTGASNTDQVKGTYYLIKSVGGLVGIN